MSDNFPSNRLPSEVRLFGTVGRFQELTNLQDLISRGRVPIDVFRRVELPNSDEFTLVFAPSDDRFAASPKYSAPNRDAVQPIGPWKDVAERI